jgi:hypothetical protein
MKLPLIKIRIIFVMFCIGCLRPAFSQKSIEQIKREKKDEKEKDKAREAYDWYHDKLMKRQFARQSKLTQKQIKEFRKESDKFNNRGSKSKNKRRFWLFSKKRQ